MENVFTQNTAFKWERSENYQNPSELDLQTITDNRNEDLSSGRDVSKAKIKHLFGSCNPFFKLHATTQNTTTTWATNSEIDGCITSQMDKSTKKVMHLKWHQLNDKTVAYTGRADSKERIFEQVKFILDCESSTKDFDAISGIEENDDGSYTFTYAINSLVKSGVFQSLNGLDEKTSLEKETGLTNSNLTLTYKGKRVKLKPILLHFDVSKAGEIFHALFSSDVSGNALSRKVNNIGFSKLFFYRNCGFTLSQLIKLKIMQSKTLRERFIYSDMMQRVLNLIVVDHCKSSVDRAGAALALSATNKEFLERLFDKDNSDITTIDDIDINGEAYKETFFKHLKVSHELTKAARYGYNPINNEMTGKQAPGLKMNGSLLTDSLPERFTKKSIWHKSKTLRHIVSIIAKISYYALLPITFFMAAVWSFVILIASHKWENLNSMHLLMLKFLPDRIHTYAPKEINYTHPDLYNEDGHNIFAFASNNRH